MSPMAFKRRIHSATFFIASFNQEVVNLILLSLGTVADDASRCFQCGVQRVLDKNVKKADPTGLHIPSP